jgi:putative transposase
MPSTHTSLHYHIVFATKNRAPYIAKDWREDLHGYLGGCIRGLGGTPLEIGGTDDHVHCLAGLKATIAPADLIREMKKASTAWVKQDHAEIFGWQEGYGAFSVGSGDLGRVAAYIRKQEEHHRRETFQEEYLRFLKRAGVPYDERYLW